MALLDTSSETRELAWELQQERPDVYRIKWLINDQQADLGQVLATANLKKEDVFKNPMLRPLQLQRYLHG